MFSSPKCNLQLFHHYFFNNRNCKYNNVSVSSSYYYLLLQHEEILVCRPLRGCSHSYGSALLLWMMRPRCHSCSHHSSRSFSSWKVMMPKVTSYDVDHGPVCFLSRPSSCLRDKRPKQYPTVEHSEVVQKCKTRRRCCCSPGKCLMSWGRAFEQQLTAVMVAASTRTLESRVKRHPPSSSKGFPASSKENKSLNVYLKGFLLCRALLMVFHAICTSGCHAILKAFEQTSSLCPSSHTSSQNTWTAGRSYCTSISFYHRIALYVYLVMGYGLSLIHI